MGTESFIDRYPPDDVVLTAIAEMDYYLQGEKVKTTSISSTLICNRNNLFISTKPVILCSIFCVLTNNTF